MKRKLLFTTAVVLMLSSASLPSIAARDYTKFYGDPAPVSAATRTIVIHPDTRYVNVLKFDTVKFVVGDQSFAWAFNVAPAVHVFKLNQVAPAGLLDHEVTCYIEPNPQRGGG